MNKILKLLKCDISWIPLYKELIWVFVLCFFCINFSSAWSYTYSWSYYFDTRVPWWNEFLVNSVPLISSYYNSDITVSCILSNFSSNLDWLQFTLRFRQALYNYFDMLSVVWVQNEILNVWNTYTFVWSGLNVFTYWFVCSSSVNVWSFFDYICTVSWDNVINQSDIWWWSCDYSEYEDQINTLSWSLASCQSDLTTCQNTNSCTQLKCENDYNLVPESSINSEYCEDRFNLIDPENCPASWWTWDIQWSSFFVNSRQIQGAWNIYLWLPDFLDWWYTYIDNWQTLEIDVENVWDENYINTILSTQTYHPSSDEFAVSFVWYLTLLMPYIIITLFIVFVWKLIRRIFK